MVKGEFTKEFKVGLDEENKIYEKVIDIVQNEGLEWLFDWEDSTVTYKAYPRECIEWDALAYDRGECFAVHVTETKDYREEKIYVKVEVAPIDAIDSREFEISWIPFFRNYVSNWMKYVEKIKQKYNLKISLN